MRFPLALALLLPACSQRALPASPLTMACQDVDAHGFVTRCVNEEVVCYAYTRGGMSCRWRGQEVER